MVIKPTRFPFPPSGQKALPYSTLGNAAQPRPAVDAAVGYLVTENSPRLTVPRPGSIQAWKLYSNQHADVTMIVLRPLGGTSFTIIGENVVTTPAGRTDVITVPDFDRINVRAGDVIAWYYLPGASPSIPYVLCVL